MINIAKKQCILEFYYKNPANAQGIWHTRKKTSSVMSGWPLGQNPQGDCGKKKLCKWHTPASFRRLAGPVS